jgi:hypothetical protein
LLQGQSVELVGSARIADLRAKADLAGRVWCLLTPERREMDESTATSTSSGPDAVEEGALERRPLPFNSGAPADGLLGAYPAAIYSEGG